MKAGMRRYVAAADPGTLAAAAIMAAAALLLFVTHGITTGWDFVGEHWDAAYYFRIATHGYASGADHALAFLPGYPILLAPAARLLRAQPFLASFLTSTALSVIAGAVLFRMLRERVGPATGLAGIALLAFSPFSIYLYNGYSEPAFFLSAVLALRWLAGGRLLLAAAATGYAFLCRPYAIALVPLFAPAAWRLVRERDFWTLGRLVALGALPGLAYAAWMAHAFGDPLIASKALAHWQQYASISGAWPWPVRALFGFRFAFRDGEPATWALSLAVWFTSVVAVLAATARLPRGLTAYSLLVLLLVLLGDALVPVNLGRHSLLAFAAFPALAVLLYAAPSAGRRERWVRHGAFAVGVLFLAGMFVVMAMRFGAGLWVS